MKIISKCNTKIKYEMIYDDVCKYLDNEFYGKNVCDFQNNRCGEKRNTNSLVGCCRPYKNKLISPLLPASCNRVNVCKYLDENKKCSVECISCKLFTCDYLHKKGIRFKIKDIESLKDFNVIQKYILKYSVFTPKEKIINRLLFWRWL
ncbi:MAG: hypothetical protein FWD82_03600 [Defluviitaleaceae bacterium]|nr:hypothetical protein [Defluviitaleaceae bacterium]